MPKIKEIKQIKSNVKIIENPSKDSDESNERGSSLESEVAESEVQKFVDFVSSSEPPNTVLSSGESQEDIRQTPSQNQGSQRQPTGEELYRIGKNLGDSEGQRRDYTTARVSPSSTLPSQRQERFFAPDQGHSILPESQVNMLRNDQSWDEEEQKKYETGGSSSGRRRYGRDI